MFYDNSILSGTKMHTGMETYNTLFYDNSILSGTKILCILVLSLLCFTITQFFQVLKYLLAYSFVTCVLR